MRHQTARNIIDLMGRTYTPKKSYLDVLTGKNIRTLRDNQRIFNQLGDTVPRLSNQYDNIVKTLTQNRQSHVADWKKYLSTTPMMERDQKRLKNYAETAKKMKTDIERAESNKAYVKSFIDTYAKTKDKVNTDYNKLLKRERLKTMMTRLGTGAGVASLTTGAVLAGHKKEASVYLDAIEKVAGKVIPFPNGGNIKNITNKSKLKPNPEYFLMANPPEKLLVGSLPGIAAGQIAGAKLYHKLNPSRKRTKKACLYSDAIEKIAGEVIKFPNANKRLINKASKMVEKLKFKNWNPYLEGAAAGVGLGLPFGYLDQSIKSCNKNSKQ